MHPSIGTVNRYKTGVKIGSSYNMVSYQQRQGSDRERYQQEDNNGHHATI